MRSGGEGKKVQSRTVDPRRFEAHWGRVTGDWTVVCGRDKQRIVDNGGLLIRAGLV